VNIVNTYKDERKFPKSMTKKLDMEKIIIAVEKCRKCDLCRTRNNTVSGDGSIDTDILFIGEAPGRNEDLQGKPFVGRAGKILDELIESIGLQRDQVYIANIIKCRPPQNRNPTKEEIDICVGYLNKQIEIIQPKIIACLGSFATSYIFEKYGLKPVKIGKVHGKIFSVNTVFGEIKIIPLFHPAVATYNINTKKVLIDDFKSLKQFV